MIKSGYSCPRCTEILDNVDLEKDEEGANYYCNECKLFWLITQLRENEGG